MVLLIPLAMGLALIIGVICHAVFFDKFTIEESIYHIPETTLNIFVSSEPASIRVFFSPDQIQSLKDLPDNGDCISLDPEEYDDGQLSFFYDTDSEKELIFADIHNNYQSSYYLDTILLYDIRNKIVYILILLLLYLILLSS